MTYCLHVMVRYELEKRLLSGSLAVADLPAAWNAQMKELLAWRSPATPRAFCRTFTGPAAISATSPAMPWARPTAPRSWQKCALSWMWTPC